MFRRKFLRVTAPLLALTALTCSTATPDPAPRKFPPGFLWGVATAAQESEGNNTNSDWDAFAKMGSAPPAGLAQNSYVLYETDSANAASLHLNSFQLSIEWARIVPKMPTDPTAPLQPGDIDQAAVAHYHAVLASLLAHGLTPVVAVTHFALPVWVDNPAATYDGSAKTFSDGSLGAWTNPVTGQALARYAEFLAREFGAQVSWWLTMDEPLVALLAGYMEGNFPPGLNDLDLNSATLPNGASPKSVLVNMIAGHALAYHAMKAVQPSAKVSFAHNTVDWEPLDPASPDDVAATERVDKAYNLAFLDALTTGDFDTSLFGAGPLEHHAEWQNTLDFLGVNYYDADFVIDKPGFLPPLDAVPCAPALKSALPQLTRVYGCPDVGPPEEPGMTKVLLKYEKRYHLPQLITESGFIDTPAGKAQRLVRTLAAVADGLAGGANVVGYTYWTLNYDYEWNDGWTQNMGLFTLAGFGEGKFADGAPGPSTDFTRVPLHPMVDVYGEIAGGNTIPSHLLGQYGAQ